MVTLVLASCATDPPCSIAGLYVGMQTSVVSGNCPGSTSSVADTFTESGTSATLSVQGLSGTCSGPVDRCTWTASCQVMVTDATDPTNSTGTIQYSWAFTSTGFTGTSAVSIPPARSVPGGCSGIFKVSGVKQ